MTAVQYKRRIAAVKTADAINAIEGVPVSRYAQVLSSSWARGEISGAQMKAAEQTADTANPSQSASGNSYDTAPASGTDTEAQPQSSTPKPWEEFARQQQEREDSFFSGDTQQPADPSDAEQSQEQDKPWIPPTPKPENKGPVGRFSGASLPDDEKK